MIRLPLRLGYLGDTPVLSRYLLDELSIADYFFDGSGEDIELELIESRRDETRDFEANTSSLALHLALSTLVDDLPSGAAVGLLFARRYRPFRDALGVMFDRGFATWDDPNGAAKEYKTPRQGCAVFLDAIAELRGFGTARYNDEAVYTAIHELGHVFNLVHDYSEANFMAGSGEKPRPNFFFRFTDADRERLADCSTSRNTAPGGADFRDRDGAQSSIRPRSRHAVGNVTISARMARERIQPFEPFELDVTVRASRSGAVIPDEVDPGYPGFRIWIDRPSGERVLYRSPRHYCPSGKTRTLVPGESFERDISIFGQSGGYPFRELGTYRVQVEFDVSRRETVRSRPIPIEVRRSSRTTYQQALFRRPSVARLFYYRDASPRSAALRDLTQFAELERRNPNAGVVQYSLGRIHANLARRTVSAASIRHQRKVASEHFKRASDHRHLGRNARRKAQALIDELKS